MLSVSSPRDVSQDCLVTSVTQGAEDSRITNIAVETIQGSALHPQIPSLNLRSRVSIPEEDGSLLPPSSRESTPRVRRKESNTEFDRTPSRWVHDELSSQASSSRHSSPLMPEKVLTGNEESESPENYLLKPLVLYKLKHEVPDEEVSVKFIAASRLGGAAVGEGLTSSAPGCNNKAPILLAGTVAAIGIAAAITKGSCTIS